MLHLLVLAMFSTVCRAEITVTDDAGQQLSLPAPAHRIIALAPHIVENLFAAGAGSHLAGAVQYSDYPEAAKQIPRIGAFNGISLEAIVAARPDLVIAWGSGNSSAILAQLATLSIPVFISEPRSLADIAANIRAFGALAGTEQYAEAAARHFEQQLARLRRPLHTNGPGIFLQLWHQPLQTVSGRHLISEVIRLCGGHNVFADMRALAPRINIESVLAKNPDIIVAAGTGAGRPDWLDDWLAYPGLRAVKNKALIYVNPDHLLRPTPRILQGAGELCAKLDTLHRHNAGT